MKKIYLDQIAATPLREEVLEAMLPYLKGIYGNPQSLHTFGQEALQALDEARDRVAGLLGAASEEIYFTSSGSESNNFALKGMALAKRDKGNHLVVSSIEHQSVLHSAKSLEKYGFQHSQVPVDQWGLIDPREVEKAITDKTVLVSILTASSEVGTLQPIPEIARVCREKGVAFHTDAVAAVGHVPIHVGDLGLDALSLSANSFYGPKGTAALYIRKGTRILPLIEGGIQEGGRRAGTENVAGIVGMGRAAELAQEDMSSRRERLQTLRDSLMNRLPEAIPHVVRTGHPELRLPFHASFCIEFVEGEAMLLNLDMQGIAVSSGSACTSKALKASHVLLAMGIDHALAQGSLVFSLIDGTTMGDIDYLLEVFPPIIERLRRMSPLYSEDKEEK